MARGWMTALGLLFWTLTTGAQEAHQNPQGELQGPDHYSFRVGDIEVTALSDGTVPQDLHALLTNTTRGEIDSLLDASFLANPYEASINAFFFRDAGHTVLVDTGSGDYFGPTYGGKLLASLALIHVRPSEITDVLLTHAHDDHLGGLVHEGNLVFPNAIIHLSTIDFAFFMDRSNSAKAHYAMSYFDQAITALKPEQDAGKIEVFRTGAAVLPGVQATVHPGHTPGSAFYTLRSHDEVLVFTGDILHVEAVQLPDPKVTIVYDVDPTEAAATRSSALAQFARDRTLIAVPHLPFPGVGHLKEQGAGYVWYPVLYANRDLSKRAVYMDPHKNGDKVQ